MIFFSVLSCTKPLFLLQPQKEKPVNEETSKLLDELEAVDGGLGTNTFWDRIDSFVSNGIKISVSFTHKTSLKVEFGNEAYFCLYILHGTVFRDRRTFFGSEERAMIDSFHQKVAATILDRFLDAATTPTAT